MQFTTFLTSVAAGALFASEAAAQQSMSMSMSMPMASGEKMTVMPSMTMAKAMPGAAKPTGAAMNAGAMKAGAMKAMVHKVMVSDEKGTLKFNPSTVQASVGHMVEFMFHPNNHSVAQAAFDKPCMPMDMAMPGMTGFYSGFMPVSGKETKTFTVMVNSTEPMWFYCSQAKHCQQGMVGVINPPAGNAKQNVDMFMMGAKNATMNVSPSKVFGGMEKMMGAAKASGKAHKSGMMGMAKGTGKMGMGMAKGTGKMGMKGVKTATGGMAMSTGGAMVTSAPVAANAIPTPAAANAPAASPAATSVKPANAAGGKGDMLSSGSPLGLLALLAAALFLCA